MWYVMIYVNGTTYIDAEYPNNKHYWRAISKGFVLREKASKELDKQKEAAPECTYSLGYIPR